MSTGGSTDRAPLTVTVALGVTLAVGAFALVMPVVMTLVPGKVLPAPFLPQHQRGETLTYLLTYAVLVPLAVLAARRLADALHAGPHAARLPALAGLLAGGLAAALVAVKALGSLEVVGDGVRTVFFAAALWWAAAAGLVLLLRGRPAAAGTVLTALRARRRLLVAAAGAGVFVVLLCFTDLRSVSVPALLLAALAVAGATALHGRIRSAPTRRWGAVADVLVVSLVLVLVPDLVIFRPEDAAGDLAVSLETGIIQFHHNFLLGPANEVLHGRAMLDGTASQYGVTSIYLLTAWFGAAMPIGYGALGLLTGLLTAGWFAAGYAILRLAGTPRWLSAGALGVAIVVLAFNLPYPVGALPQSGPLRFGMPMALLLFAVLAERRPSRLLGALAPAVLGLASVWSFEALAFTGVTFAALALARATLAAPGARLRTLAAQALAGGLACVVAHVLFAAITLAATGDLPRWGQYIAYLRQFLGGEVGELTYDVERWTPGFAVGAVYAASAVGLAELRRRRPPMLEAERTAAVALVGMTAYGAVLLSYYVDRSQGHILIHVALPALLVGTLWLGLVLRAQPAVALASRRAALGSGLAIAALLLAVAASSVDGRFERSPLALAAPGGDSLRGAVERLADPPPLNPSAPDGERALARHLPGERRSLLVVSPDLGVEVLIRSDRSDALHLGDPTEASFAKDAELPIVRSAVNGLRPGRRMLMDRTAVAVLVRLRAEPRRDVLVDPLKPLAPLQQWALRRIDERFELRPVGRPIGAFSVVELTARA